MGLLDQFSGDGLMGGAGAFLQNPSFTPQSTSGNFGRGLLGYQEAKKEAELLKLKALLGASTMQHQSAMNEHYGIQNAATLQGLLGAQAEAQKNAQFYSPENKARFTSPATPALPPITPADDDGNPMPGVAGKPGVFDLKGFAEAGAAQGVKGMDPLLNHLALRQQAETSALALAQSRRDSLEARLHEIDTRSEDRALSREQRAQDAAESRALRLSLSQLAASNHRERMVPVQGADGNVTYQPESTAAGLQVGKPGSVNQSNPKMVQQLGRDLEKAGLPSTIQVIDSVKKIGDDQMQYLTGPGALLPDPVVPADARIARQDVQRLFNITLKDRSGAAVTNQEMNRLKTEYGKGVLKSPSQLKDALEKAEGIVAAHYEGISAGYGSQVLDAYNRNLESVGGTPFKRSGKGPSVGDVKDGYKFKGGNPADPSSWTKL